LSFHLVIIRTVIREHFKKPSLHVTALQPWNNTRTRTLKSRSKEICKFRTIFAWQVPSDFWSRLVIMGETWLYHYDRRQGNNQWSDGIGVCYLRPAVTFQEMAVYQLRPETKPRTLTDIYFGTS
jgi:hypothetical protein